MAYVPLDVSRTLSGTDEQCRTFHSIAAFRARERGSSLDTLYYYWDALRGGHQLAPRTDEFHPEHVFGHKVSWMACSVDVHATDPRNFVICDHPGGVLLPVHGGLRGKRVI